jgi:hypothetical protein
MRGLSAVAVAVTLAGHAAGGQSPFDPKRLTAGEQAFELRAGGRAVGTLTASLGFAAGEWTYVETTLIPGRTEQTTRARISATGELIAVMQKGNTPAGATHIDVRYEGGRAKGTATVPAPGGLLRTIEIDAAVARFAIDDNLLQPLLPALPLEAGASKVIQIFKSGQGTSTDMTLVVAGEERIDVPFGAFDSWKVTAKGTPNVSFFVAKRAPYQLLRMTVEGSPLEMVRVK